MAEDVLAQRTHFVVVDVLVTSADNAEGHMIVERMTIRMSGMEVLVTPSSVSIMRPCAGTRFTVQSSLALVIASSMLVMPERSVPMRLPGGCGKGSGWSLETSFHEALWFVHLQCVP